MASDDPTYIRWLHAQPCAECGSAQFVEAHHHTSGDVFAPDAPRPPRTTGARRGKSQKASDYFAFALCAKHHRQFHDAAGQFKGWDRARRRAWQDDQVISHRARYLAEQSGEPLPPPTTAPPPPRTRRSLNQFPQVALSLRQPWAWMMLNLAETWRKRIENRTWGPTSHRGPFWFHASGTMTKRDYAEACAFAVDAVGVPADLMPQPEAIHLGGIVGIGSIVAHIRPEGGTIHFDPHERPLELFEGRDPRTEQLEAQLNRAWHMEGQFGYVVPDAEPVDFVPCPGMLGFWKVPEDVLEELRRQAA